MIEKFVRIIAIVMLVFICSCDTKNPKFDPDDWYKKTKEFILKESSLLPDSTETEYYDDGKPHKIRFFSNGIPIGEKWYRATGEQAVETNFSRDGQFELRKEICQDGKVAFEGVFYKKEPYGLSTWFGCGEFKQQQGIRFRDKKVGIWKSWDGNGKETNVDYKNNELIDSLKLIGNTESGVREIL